MHFRHLAVFFCLISSAYTEEILDENKESLCLQHIEQITFSSMGFEKAGEAYFSPDGTEIIFQAVPKGEENYQIYTMELSERKPKMVSTGFGACTCGFYRPDGKKIIFASSHEDKNPAKKSAKKEKYTWDLTPYMNIYEADLDGSNLRKLTSGAAYHAECSYSPDCSSILYASNEDGSMNLYVMRADGSNVRKLTHTNHCYNGGPFFSPDGSSIIFRADRDKSHFLQLFMIDTLGSNERQLTTGEVVNWAPFWHPNGKVIAYTTSKHGCGAYEIYLMNIESRKEYRLTYSSFFEGLPTFNKEGNKILWTSKRSDDNSCQIFIADFMMPSSME